MKKNPLYLNGECTEDQILQRFLTNFETSGIQDAVVSVVKILKGEMRWHLHEQVLVTFEVPNSPLGL